MNRKSKITGPGIPLAALLVAAAACGGPGQDGERGSAGADWQEAGRTADLPAGTEIQVLLLDELSTRDSEVGDSFEAEVVSAGSTDALEGARVAGIVTAVQPSGSAGEPAVLKVDFRTVEHEGTTYELDATLLEAHPETRSRTSTGEGVAKAGAAAAGGAIVGRIIGGDAKGALIGAAVGAAAGTAIVLGTQDVDGVLPDGSLMRLRLDAPLQVEVAAAH
jgi:hypothetical protein